MKTNVNIDPVMYLHTAPIHLEALPVLVFPAITEMVSSVRVSFLKYFLPSKQKYLHT